MKIRGRLSGVMLLLPLLQLPTAAVAQDAPFNYSDDWGLVSAPPPPGPYQAVNIDPRVPGQDAIPPISTDVETVHGWAEMPAEIDVPPPAAGRPASAPAMEQPLQHRVPGSYGPAPVPGAYDGSMQGPSGYQVPQPTGMPGPAPYTDYGSMPPSGYYGSPAVQMEEEVPPPPVYDAMTGETSGAYGRPRGQ